MMKKYISIIFITLAVAGSSCKKDYLNLTTNPNTPSVASPNLLLTGALKSTADIVNGPNMQTVTTGSSTGTAGTGYIQYDTWVGYLSQSTGFQPFVAIELYQFTTSSFDDWTPNYLNISNYAALSASTTEPYYQAIAKIMTAFDYEALVDNYNNVPYSTAIKGTGNLNPAYAKGTDIYADLFKQLDAAIALIQKAPATALSPGKADIMYSGTMSNWVKFANTLKLRLAIRLSNQTPATIANPALTASALQTEINASSGGYLDASNPAVLNPGYINSDADGGQQSPLWRNYGTTAAGASQTNNNEYQANSFLANFYGINQDPRLIRVYAPSATAKVTTAVNLLPGSSLNTYPDAKGVLQGVVSTDFGDSQPPTSSNIGGLTPSKVGPGVLPSPSMNATIMSSEEALFLEAEATVRGYTLTGPQGLGLGSAQSLYNAGVAASFTDLNAQVNTVGSTAPLTPAASAAVFTAPGGKYAFPINMSDQITAIITQKWAALAIFGAFESFNEERRTGIPAVPTSIFPGANAPNQITRIFYPFIEYQTNATNVAAQGTIDKFSSKIFWAK